MYRTDIKRLKHSSLNRSAFTLVELLVVISIIAMLAALLMPAIQAARESARRAQCTSNQRQVALALITYDSTHNVFPALRSPLRPAAYKNWSWDKPTPDATEIAGLTWVGYILPYIEHSTAWAQINSGKVNEGLYELVIPFMQCKSSGIMPGEHRINYVVNAGPQNVQSPLDDRFYESPNPTGPWTQVRTEPSTILGTREYGNPQRPRKDERKYTLFFDHFVSEGTWLDSLDDGNGYVQCETRSSMSNVSTMDGTSWTILLTENVDAGHWIWYDPKEGPNSPMATNWYSLFELTGSHRNSSGELVYTAQLKHYNFDMKPADRGESDYEFPADVEAMVGFCRPPLAIMDDIEVPVYVPMDTGWQDDERTPLFINEGRSSHITTRFTNRGRLARPSSEHPGVVLASYCDGSVRVVRDSVDKILFSQLSRPGSGVIINPRDLN